jgi:hypothetical protein
MSTYGSMAEDISVLQNPFDKDPINGCYGALEAHRLRQIDFGSDPKNPEQLESIAEEGRGWIKTVERSFYKLGGLAIIVKKIQPHGEFQPWIKKEWGLSYETVNLYMNVYRVCFGRWELVHKFKKGSLCDICRPRFPEKLREYMLERGQPDATIKEVWDFAKGFKEGKYDLDHPIVKRWYAYQDDSDEYEQYKKDSKIRMAKIKNLHQKVGSLKKGAEWPIYKGRVSLSVKEAEKMENDKKEFHNSVDELYPSDYEIIDDDKPKFDMSKM